MSEIVIGIDFGTTHSGVSWAIKGGSRNIHLIDNWDDPQALNSNRDKVPSSIAYVNGKPNRWGYTVEPSDESFKWIKILLEPNHKYAKTLEPVRKSNALLTKLQKDADEVVTDYLRFLWDYTKNDIRKYHDDFEEIYSLNVVLTVPAMWSPAAKEKTRQAARAAGMPENIQLVTEPEAAALATLKDKAESNELQVGDAFVVCDAGGGTVDLISYKILELNPLKIEECAIGSGDLCGSIFLDLAFESYIMTIVGKEEYLKIKERNRKLMILEFEQRVKRSFGRVHDRQYSVDLRGVEDNVEHGIIDDTIKLNNNLLKTVFDHVCLQIQKLVEDQISEVKEKGLAVKAVLLVGGFGENTYLYDMLKGCHTQRGIKVLKVDRAWSAICRGATMWGLEHSSLTTRKNEIRAMTTVSRLSRYSYGLSLSNDYDPTQHLPIDKYYDEHEGTWKAGNQMTWLLKRGDEIKEGRVLDTEMYLTVQAGLMQSGSQSFTTSLYYSEEDVLPSRKTDSVNKLCRVDYSVPRRKLHKEKSFKSAQTGDKWRHASFMMYIKLGNAALDFSVKYRDEEVGHVEANYMK